MASGTTSEGTRLAFAILRFLKDELSGEENSPDRVESLEVAIQCIKLAYDIEEEDPAVDSPKLLDIFVKAVPPPKEPEPLSEDKKAEAEKLKQDGNDLMKKESFNEAITSYTKAIEIDRRNAVYYCNRAAAYTGLGNHESALSDCRKAISIDKSYSKAYSRMGLTYSKMEQYELAVDSYEKALKLDPNNEGYKRNMEIAKEQIAKKAAVTSIPGMEAMGGMAEMMNSPAFMNMAQQVLANPGMQQMAMNMMSGFMRPPQQGDDQGSGGTGGQAPDMAGILQMGQQFAAQMQQSNPEVVNQLKEQMKKPPNGDDKGST